MSNGFEGRTINGSKEGYGKLYDDNNKLVYEGNFLNNRYHGQGTLYYENGEIEFSGEFENGIPVKKSPIKKGFGKLTKIGIASVIVLFIIGVLATALDIYEGEQIKSQTNIGGFGYEEKNNGEVKVETPIGNTTTTKEDLDKKIDNIGSNNNSSAREKQRLQEVEQSKKNRQNSGFQAELTKEGENQFKNGN